MSQGYIFIIPGILFIYAWRETINTMILNGIFSSTSIHPNALAPAEGMQRHRRFPSPRAWAAPAPDSKNCCPGQVSPHPEATANLGHWPDDVLPMPAKKLWRAKLNLFGIKGCPFRSGALADEICVRNLTRRMG